MKDSGKVEGDVDRGMNMKQTKAVVKARLVELLQPGVGEKDQLLEFSDEDFNACFDDLEKDGEMNADLMVDWIKQIADVE